MTHIRKVGSTFVVFRTTSNNPEENLSRKDTFIPRCRQGRGQFIELRKVYVPKELAGKRLRLVVEVL